MVIKVGMIGLSPGNGHPFSFSAIINGFDEAAMATSGWPVIHTYLKRRHASEFGFGDVLVTHAWTQDPDQTRTLCNACGIAHAVEHPDALLGAVDAVIIARDDYERHWEMAKPFLEAGLPVFVDKPLSLSIEEVSFFLPYAAEGLLMTCSAMRYARELDELRAGEVHLGEQRLIRATTVNDWPKYAIHMLDAIFGATSLEPEAVLAHADCGESVIVLTSSATQVQINALGEGHPVFHIDVFGEEGRFSCNIRDNFTMFRRMLWQFVEMVRSGERQISEEELKKPLLTLIAGDIALREHRRVGLDELRL